MTFCKTWRKRMGLTQKDAAKILDCTERTIRNYDRDTPLIAKYAMLYLEENDDL